MTDREMLERAAKAAGVKHWWDGWSDYGRETGDYWNPLTDDGDALRLAVKCRMNVHIYYNDTRVTADDVFLCEMHEVDLCEATRRAIVRAAAEIGRNMK